MSHKFYFAGLGTTLIGAALIGNNIPNWVLAPTTSLFNLFLYSASLFVAGTLFPSCALALWHKVQTLNLMQTARNLQGAGSASQSGGSKNMAFSWDWEKGE